MRRVQNPSVVQCAYSSSQAPGHCRFPGRRRDRRRFLTTEPDEDFVDPADEYKMPWEEDMPLQDMPLQDMPLLEGVSSKAGNALSYAASIGLEISGSREFVTDECALVLEFWDIFSTELSPEPADLPPLDVPIDTKWH